VTFFELIVVNDRNRNQNRNHSGPVPVRYIFTETGMAILFHTVRVSAIASSIHSKTTLTARSKILCISILLHKNLLNRVISLYCRKNLPLFFFEYIGSSEILQIFEILFWYWVSVLVSFRFSKKSIFRFPLY